MNNIGNNLRAALAAMADAATRRIYGAATIERVIRQYSLKQVDHAAKGRGSIAQFNRHTGRPHEHVREKARRRRQADKRAG